MNADIRFFSCGNGDTILVRAGEDWALIDANLRRSHRDEERLVQVLQNEGVERLKFVCVTHYDLDHLRGLASLIETRFGPVQGQWRVGQIIQPLPRPTVIRMHGMMRQAYRLRHCDDGRADAEFSNQAWRFLDLTRRMTRKGVYMPDYHAGTDLRNPPDCTESVLFGRFAVHFLAPEQEEREQYAEQNSTEFFKKNYRQALALERYVAANDISRVIAFRHIDTGQSILLGGDAPSPVWERILRRWQETLERNSLSDRRFSVIKVSHHGASNSHHDPLYADYVHKTRNRRSIAVISCKAGDLKHPHPDVWKKLTAAGISVECTSGRKHLLYGRGFLAGTRRVNEEAVDIQIEFSPEGMRTQRHPVRMR